MKPNESTFVDKKGRALELPKPESEKLSEVELRKLLWQRDQSITYVYHKFSICGFKSVSEVKAIIKTKNLELYKEIDDIIDELQSINAINVVGDRVFCETIDKFVNYKSDPLQLQAFLGEYIKTLVNRVLKNIIGSEKNKSLNSMHWFTLPGDKQTLSELQEARIKYQKEVHSISEKANAEKRRSQQTVVSFFAVSTPQAEDF